MAYTAFYLRQQIILHYNKKFKHANMFSNTSPVGFNDVHRSQDSVF